MIILLHNIIILPQSLIIPPTLFNINIHHIIAIHNHLIIIIHNNLNINHHYHNHNHTINHYNYQNLLIHNKFNF
jgi:hypothetical protein